MDFGTEINIMTRQGYGKFQSPPELRNSSVKAKAIHGTRLQFDGEFDATIELDDKMVTITLQLTQDVSAIILSIPDLFELNVSPILREGFGHSCYPHMVSRQL